jgi:hypothetical protein
LFSVQTEDIVHYHRHWLENVVKEVAMASPRSGCGQQVLYDNVIIQEHLFQRLVKGKPQLADAVSSHLKWYTVHLIYCGLIIDVDGD